MNTFTELVAHTNFIHIIGVRFRPCGLFRFIDIPLNELTNQGIDSQEFPVLLVNLSYINSANPIKIQLILLNMSWLDKCTKTTRIQKSKYLMLFP